MTFSAQCQHCNQPITTHRAWLRSFAWVSLSVLGLWVLLGGHADLYIAPSIDWTLELAIPVALGMSLVDGYAAWQHTRSFGLFAAMLRDIGHVSPSELFQGLVFLPLLFGLTIKPSVLNSASLSGSDSVISYVAAPISLTGPKESEPARSLNLLQLRDRMGRHSIATNTTITTTGFIYHPDALPQGEVLLVRYITLHCMAEAQPIAIVLYLSSTQHLPANNTWVHATGHLTGGNLQSQSVAILDVTALQQIAQPHDPYLIY